MPTAYSTEAKASAISVASSLYHDLLNSKEHATVWSLPPKAHSASKEVIEGAGQNVGMRPRI